MKELAEAIQDNVHRTTGIAHPIQTAVEMDLLALVIIQLVLTTAEQGLVLELLI